MNAERLQKLQEWEALKPTDAFLKFAIAQEFTSNGQDEDALPYLELLVEKFGDYLPTYYQLGKLYERLGKYDNATSTYIQGTEIAKQNKDAKTLRELNEAILLIED